MHADRAAALLELVGMAHAGQLDEADFDAAVARIDEALEAEGLEAEGPADLTPGEAASDDAPHDEAAPEGKAMGMAGDDLEGMGGAAPAAVRPHGYEALSRMHKGMSRLRKAIEADMGPLDNANVRQHMGQHLDGMGKACKAIKAMCKKEYKDHDELPDEWPDDDAIETKDLAAVDEDDGMGMETNAVDGGMSALDSSEGGALLGERPEDEAGMEEGMEGEEEEEMSDEEAEFLAKSLPALERQLGLR